MHPAGMEVHDPFTIGCIVGPLSFVAVAIGVEASSFTGGIPFFEFADPTGTIGVIEIAGAVGAKGFVALAEACNICFAARFVGLRWIGRIYPYNGARVGRRCWPSIGRGGCNDGLAGSRLGGIAGSGDDFGGRSYHLAQVPGAPYLFLVRGNPDTVSVFFIGDPAALVVAVIWVVHGTLPFEFTLIEIALVAFFGIELIGTVALGFTAHPFSGVFVAVGEAERTYSVLAVAAEALCLEGVG